MPYAWLVFGSGARSELTLASDQDNGLAYADTDDPTARRYFRPVAEDVNVGLERCGFAADPHGVLARTTAVAHVPVGWRAVFTGLSPGARPDRMARPASRSTTARSPVSLVVVPALTDILREAPRHSRFLGGLDGLAVRSARRWASGAGSSEPVDIKKSGLLPIQNLARYHAFARGITATTTLERLAAVHATRVCDGGVRDGRCGRRS